MARAKDDKRPLCPKCGEPARTVLVKAAYVKCILEADGKYGDVISFGGMNGETAQYTCGGGHNFEGKEPNASSL